jgi:hypothetical protein
LRRAGNTDHIAERVDNFRDSDVQYRFYWRMGLSAQFDKALIRGVNIFNIPGYMVNFNKSAEFMEI